jgi:hypothetical protein
MKSQLRTAIAAGAIALALLPAAAWAAEQLAYQVVDYYSGFEVRRYPRHLVAETQASGPFEQVSKEALQVLSAYLSGNNRRPAALEIAAPAATPPQEEPDKERGEKIEMVGPVTQVPAADSAGKYTFAFVLPAKYTLDTLPQPLDPRVTIREVPERLVAARRFSEKWSEAACRRNERSLLIGVETARLQPVGTPFYARYNTPMGLWFMRRSEAMVEVAQPAGTGSR